MSGLVILIVLTGALAGGFVSGLAGFGTAMVALGVWLHVLDPAPATSLVLICSVLAQSITMAAVLKTLRWKMVLPFIIPGLVGVPVGTWLLTIIDPSGFKLGVGIFLLLFSCFLLLVKRPLGLSFRSRVADGAVGFLGGVLGGLEALSGPPPIIWATLQGWSKEERRAVFQSFNTAILVLSLITHASSGLVTAQVGALAILALPGTILGALAGLWTYRRLSDRRFNQAVLCLLFLSGALLVWSGFAGGRRAWP